MSLLKDFSWPTNTFNSDDHTMFCKCIEENRSSFVERDIFLFGAGIRGCLFLSFCQKKEIPVTGIVDNDKNKQGGTILSSYPIFSLQDVLTRFPNAFFIISVEISDSIIKQLIGAGKMMGRDFFSVPPMLYKSFIHSFYTPQARRIFLGDCLFSTVGMSDTDMTSLGALLLEQLGSDIYKILSIHGMPMHTFYHMLDLQIKMKYSIDLVILAVNTVMFSGKKGQLPRAQHTPLLKEIQGQLPFYDSEFDDYIKLTEERMRRFRTDAFVSNAKTATSHNNENIVRLRTKQNYIYELHPDNESVIFLKRFIALCNVAGIRLILFFPPINYQHGENILGEQFTRQCKLNMKKLKEALLGGLYETIDMSFSLESDYFAATDTINEITNYEGRLRERDTICEYLKIHS